MTSTPHRTALWLALAMLSVACGDDTSSSADTDATAGTGSDETALPPEVAEARALFEPLVRAQCQHAFACCDADELAADIGPAVADVDTCVERALDVMQAGGSPPTFGSGTGYLANLVPFFAYGLDEDIVAVDEAGFAACAEEIMGLGCAASAAGEERCTPPSAVPSGACETSALFSGLRGVGEDCSTYSGLECAPGLTCDIYGAGVGVCVEALGEGDGCFFDHDCGAGLVCDYAAGTCTQAGDLGAPCSYADAEDPDVGTEIVRCRAGLVCDPISDSCRPAECAFGEYCSDDRDCPQGLECVSGQCDFLALAGERCWNLEDCASGLCVFETEGSFCRDLAAAGEPCQAHEQCDSTYCEPATATCSAQLAPGAACDPLAPAQQCANGYCNGLECVAFGDPGDACPPAECNYVVGDACLDGACVAYPYPDGVACSGDYACESGHCRGVCGDPTPVGEPCAAGSTECGELAYCATTDDRDEGTCAARLGHGAPCSSDVECWGGCSAVFGELRCSGVGPGQAICDGA
jgi:hypothetical protein